MGKTRQKSTHHINPFLGRDVEGARHEEVGAEQVGTDLILGTAEETTGPRLPLGIPSDEEVLGVTDDPAEPGITVAGLHGGAGASTVAALMSAQGRIEAIERAAGAIPRGSDVVCVARTSGVGCDAARRAAAQWGSGGLELDVLGLVLVPDGVQTPRELRRQLRQVAAMWPRAWSVGWVPTWHLNAVADVAAAPLRARSTVARINKAHQRQIKETQ